MAERPLFTSTEYAAANYSAATPDTTADPWASISVDANSLDNALPGNPPTPSITTIAGLVNIREDAFYGDYFNRIHVVPPLIEVDNPQLGTEYEYGIWSTFEIGNTMLTITPTDATGLFNSATAPLAFKAFEFKSFFVEVLPTAPLSIEATWLFTFTMGSGLLTFIAERANIVPVRPEQPVKQVYEWRTDVMRAWDGTEQRISLRPRPRQRLEYDIILSSDVEIRRQRGFYFRNLASPVVLPVWHEAFRTTVEAPVSTTSIIGDFSMFDAAAGDFIYFEAPGEAFGELLRLATKSNTLLTTDVVLSNTFPVGSIVHPVVTGLIPDGSSIQRYAVNAAQLPLRLDVQAMKVLGGATAVVPTYQSLPLLDKQPLAEGLVNENFTIEYERIDYGNQFFALTSQEFPNITQPREFLIRSQAELQFWKKFLDTVVGQREPFYFPTYRNDLDVLMQPVQGGSSFVTSVDPDYEAIWSGSTAHQDFMIVTGDGQRLPRRLNDAVNNGDGTMQILLDSALPNTPQGSTIVRVEFLELVRLGSDKVELEHFDTHSFIKIVLRTVEG